MAILRDLKTARFSFARKLLHGWIRPTILGCNQEVLGLLDTDSICYVMPFRSTADLMVVDHACESNKLPLPTEAIATLGEARAFFFLGHPEGTFGRRSLRPRSPRMTRLFERQADNPDVTIKMVPVSLFWGHQPDREKSIFKLLLSEQWSVTSRAKKFLAALFHRHHILVQYGPAINLKELMGSETDRRLQIRKLLRILRVHFNRQKQAILGPDLSHRRTLLSSILASPGVRAAIKREAGSKDVSLPFVEKKALEYAEEIASDVSYRIIRFFDLLLTWLWNRLYNGVEVNGINRVKELAQHHELIYIPCHRSHIDYLLLSHVLYRNGLTPPHIAAGKNLKLPLVGPILRRGGAFFMRRSFQGDLLYKEVFDEYLHQMFTRGYAVGYFIEGKRSRTGRTLEPRTGMLRMTLRSFQRDSTRPIAFLPVYLGYEQVLESSTYVAELAGKDKKTESVFDVFRVLRSFRHSFGEVTVNFGQPVLLEDFLKERHEDWRRMNRLTFNGTCLSLARTLVCKINAAAAIKPTNLVALSLLATPQQRMQEAHLRQHLRLLMNIARLCGPDTLSFTSLSLDDIIAEAVEIVGLSRKKHHFGHIISASAAQVVGLTYNANNIVHLFALVSLVARYLKVRRSASITELIAYCGLLFPYMESEMFLHFSAAELPDEVRRVVNALSGMHLVRNKDGNLHAPSPESDQYISLHEISRISDPTLERFYIAITLLQQGASSIKELEVAASGIAQQLSALYGINSPDFFDPSLFTSFLNTLRQRQLLLTEKNRLSVTPGLAGLEDAIATTMDPDVRYNVLQTVSSRQQAGPAVLRGSFESTGDP